MLRLVYTLVAITVATNGARMSVGDNNITTPPPLTIPALPLTTPAAPSISLLSTEDQWVDGALAEMLACKGDDGGEAGHAARKGVVCPATHDGLVCWPETLAGTYAKVMCPASLLHQSNSSGDMEPFGGHLASRYCGGDGVWEPDTGDYLPCATRDIFTKKEATAEGGEEGEGGEETASLLRSIVAARMHLCVQQMHAQPPRPTDGHLFCPRTFDGWSCWNDTPAGETAYSPCPYFITGFDNRRMAHKLCNEDGMWFKHPDNNRTWSNYTTCIDLDDLMMRQLINTIYIAGYSVSLVALAISLVIFFYFRTLQCTRIRLHKNLFVSFMINNIMWIAWYLEVADKPETVLDNSVGCQVLHILVQYFLVSSYSWMFSEGVYLHTLLVVAFVSEERLMKWFFLLGWGAPAIIVAVYAFVRGTAATDTQLCWIEESHYTFILSAPVCVSILVNLVFLVNIVRVLVTKLRANHVTPDTNGTRKAVRATLILIPLLGLHYVLMPFRPSKGSHWELVYEIIAAVASSFQGFCVALLFCFCNSEVVLAVKKKWYQYQFMHDHRRFSFTSACIMSVNGVKGMDPKKLSPYRATFPNSPQMGARERQGEGGGGEYTPHGSRDPSPSPVEFPLGGDGGAIYRPTIAGGDTTLLLESHRVLVETARRGSLNTIAIDVVPVLDDPRGRKKRRRSYDPSRIRGMEDGGLMGDGRGAAGDAIELQPIKPTVVTVTLHEESEQV